jgi:hypothetical protein
MLKSQIGSQLWKTDGEVDIKGACETIRENIKILARESISNYELKKYKPWFNEECSNY